MTDAFFFVLVVVQPDLVVHCIAGSMPVQERYRPTLPGLNL